MIYKHLKIRNIASIAEADIDFENGYLKDESLILICGETGAGKTTILDAICLALFATTPRMNAAKKEDYNDKLKTDDVRQVLRKGESNCLAELRFEGVNGKLYTARFEFGVKKRTETLGSVKHTLINETDHITFDKITQTKAEITEKAVGSDIENFCRTNMLAQGEFNRFLDGKEEDKAKVLEKLTGTEIYTLLGQKIFETWSEKSKAVEKENELVKDRNKKLLPEEERNELNEKAIFCNERIEALGKAKNEYVVKASWLKQLQNIEQGRLQAKKDLNTANAAMATPQFADETKLIADLATAQEENALATIADLDLHKEKLKELKKEEASQQQSALQIANVMLAHAQELGRQKEQLASLTKQLDAIPSLRKKMLENAGIVCSNIDNMINSSSEELSHKSKAQIFADKEQALKQKTDKLRVNIAEDEETCKQAELLVKEAQAILKKLNPERVNQQVNDVQVLIGETVGLHSKLDRLNETTEAKNTAEKELHDSTNLLPELERQKKDAEQELKNAKYVYEHVQLSTNEYARHLRHEVKVGDYCPVCGKEVEKEISEDFFVSLLQKPKEVFDKAEHHYGNICTQLNATEEIIQRLYKDLDAKVKAWKKAQADFDKQLQAVKEKAETIGENIADLSTIPAIKAYTDALECKLKELKAQQEEVIKKNHEYQKLQEKLENTNKLLSNGKDSLHKQENELAKCQTDREKELGLAENARKAAEKFCNDTNQLLGTSEWIENKEELGNFGKQLKNDANHYSTNKERQAGLLQKILLTEQDIDAATQIFNGLKNRLPNWDIIPTAGAGIETNLVTYINSAVKNIDNWLNECKNQQTSINEKEACMDAFLLKHAQFTAEYLQTLVAQKNNIKQYADNHDRINKKKNDADAQLEAFKNRTDELQQSKPAFTDEEEGRDAQFFENKYIQLDADIKECTDKSADCRMRLEADKELRATIAAKLAAIEELKAELAPWEELKRIFGDAQGKTFKKIAQNYILSALLVAANRHLKQFAPRFTLIANPGQLTILALDAENLNEPLSSTSLSGGQKFMVSLALALGLAEMCGGVSTGANILFIDEGFGSLDDERLDSVMNCLEKLHQNAQRKVAIISHVERLRTQIPTHIEVKALPGTTAASRIAITNMQQTL